MQYLYLLESDGYYKIGIANDVQSRIAQLSTGNPHAIGLISCYGFNNAEIVERAIHQRFAGERQRGEWFRLTGQNIAEFDDMCGLLGGLAIRENDAVSEADIEEAEELAQPVDGGKWDYAAMFADGWKMAVSDGRGRYWSWKRTVDSQKRETIYGGTLSSLPYPIEKMRNVYGLENPDLRVLSDPKAEE